MYEVKKIGKEFTSKFVGTGPSSYKKRIYRAAVSQRLRNTALEHIQYAHTWLKPFSYFRMRVHPVVQFYFVTMDFVVQSSERAVR